MIEDIVGVLADTAPEIRAELPKRREVVGAENPSAEVQLAADVHADELLAERLLALDGVGAYGSEERDEVLTRGSGVSVAVDPLDGSSNLKSNNSMGTIVGVFDASLPAAGADLLAAMYVLYGPITTMMVAHGGTVTETVIADDGSQRVLDEDVQLPSDPVVYGFGGRVPEWTDSFTTYARSIERELKLRYGGAYVGDVNQVLTYGGVFAYPELEDRPEGKLRLQFEGIPVGFIVETAGGRASDGEGALLEKTPTGLHERSPVYVGNPELIERRESIA